MEIEYILMGIVIVFLIFYFGNMEFFQTSDTLLREKYPDISKEQETKMDDTIDNSNAVTQYSNELVYDMATFHPLENKYGLNLPFDRVLNKTGLSFNDAYSAQEYNRGQNDKKAILGKLRSGVPFMRRIHEAELREDERRDWWESTAPDIQFHDIDKIRPEYKKPDPRQVR